MKIRYLGTAAAEGVPAVFCQCHICKMARRLGGKNVRMRSGALIDGRLKLDFGPDSYAQMLRFGESYEDVEHVLITHSHEDHFLPTDLNYIHPPFGHREKALNIWGDEKVGGMLEPYVGTDGMLVFHRMLPGDEADVGGYHVTALRAVHVHGEVPLFYRVEKDGKALIYAHDTDEFPEDVMEYLKGKRHDLISLDCTNGVLQLDYVGHMGIGDNIRMREKLMDIGAADEKTVFVCNHFSHNGMAEYGEMEKLAKGFVIAYDGMEMEI